MTQWSPVNFSSESLSQPQMQQLATNQQWLFENMSKIRYSVGSVTRDSGLKVLVGKNYFPSTTERNYTTGSVSFGSYFAQGSRVVVISGVEARDPGNRYKVVVRGRSDADVDHQGFDYIISADTYSTLPIGGYVCWMAVGW